MISSESALDRETSLYLRTSMRKALFFMLLSGLSFTFVNSAVRFVDHLPTFELVFFRSVGSALCCWIWLFSIRQPMAGNKPGWLILRATFGLISLSLFFRALQIMPIGSGVSLRYLSPFFASALAAILLGERMKKLQWLFLATAFGGVILLKGFDTRISNYALILILVSALFSGMVYTVIRRIGKSEHPVVVVNYFMTAGALVGGIMCFFDWVQPVGIQWLVLIGMGVFGFLAQVFMTKALQLAEANVVTPFKYIEVILTLLAGWWLFGEYQSWIAIVAMFIIVASLLANVWVKQRKASSESP